jgi:hypothetical protein
MTDPDNQSPGENVGQSRNVRARERDVASRCWQDSDPDLDATGRIHRDGCLRSAAMQKAVFDDPQFGETQSTRLLRKSNEVADGQVGGDHVNGKVYVIAPS